MHIFYFIFVQFMQLPVLHFGLVHALWFSAFHIATKKLKQTKPAVLHSLGQSGPVAKAGFSGSSQGGLIFLAKKLS